MIGVTGHPHEDESHPCSSQTCCWKTRASHCRYVTILMNLRSARRDTQLDMLSSAGVIERRRQARRNNTAELTPGNGLVDTAENTGRNTPRTGFDKVKLRGGGVPERRITSTGAMTPQTMNGSPESSAFYIPNDERQPLLNSSKK